MTEADAQVYVYSRAYLGGLAWTHVHRDGRQTPTEPPYTFEQFIDVQSTSLVLAECNGRELWLLLWALPTKRAMNAGGMIRTCLLFSWAYEDETAFRKTSRQARTVAAAWLDRLTRERFERLVNLCFEDDESRLRYRVTGSFFPVFDEILHSSLENTASESAAPDPSPQLRLNSEVEQARLAQILRTYELPSSRSAPASCLPLVIVTEYKLPVPSVWQMLTALPQAPPTAVSTREKTAAHGQPRPLCSWGARCLGKWFSQVVRKSMKSRRGE